MSDTLPEREDRLPLVGKNHSEHECSEPDCPCHEWVKRDAVNCPRCGRTMQSDFDPDVGIWRECVGCDYREAVPSTEPVSYSGPQRCWRHGKTSCGLCPTPTTGEHEPAARGGGDSSEWHFGYEGSRYHVRPAGNGDCIAHTQSAWQANQIITEHNQHQSLVAEWERLLVAMRELLVEAEVSCVLWQQSRGFVGTADDAYAKNLMPETYKRARQLLAVIDQKGGPQ